MKKARLHKLQVGLIRRSIVADGGQRARLPKRSMMVSGYSRRQTIANAVRSPLYTGFSTSW